MKPHFPSFCRFTDVGWTILAIVILLPVSGWAHGEIMSGGQGTTHRIVQGKTGKYRLEFTISPSLPTADSDTNMELKAVRILPKPDPLLGSEVPVTAIPHASVLDDQAKKVLDPKLSVHSEGEAGVFGVDDYQFRRGGSLLLRFVVHTNAGENLTVDFPVTVKADVAAAFHLWLNLAITVLIMGLVGLQLWRVRARGGRWTEMARPVAVGAVCWAAMFLFMDKFVLKGVLALRKTQEASPPASLVKANSDGSYTIPTNMQKALGIQLVAAKEMVFDQGISVYGTVQSDPDRTTNVIAPLWGRIEFSNGRLAVGDKVKKGQELVRVILELSQVERGPMEAKQVDIQGALLRARNRRDAAKIEYQQKQRLFAVNPAYRQDMEWAKEIFDEADNAYQQIAKQEKIYIKIMKWRDPRKTPVYSPMNGTITSIGFTPGQLDLTGQFRKLFTISDLSKVWVRGDAYLPDIWSIKRGERVRVHPAGRKDVSLPGVVRWVGDAVDPATRTVPVLVNVPNPHLALAIGEFVQIEFPRTYRKALVVPARAVVDDGTHQHVYLASGPETFQPVPVKIGAEKNGWWEVVSGLHAGDRVLSNGAGLLSVASKPEVAQSGAGEVQQVGEESPAVQEPQMERPAGQEREDHGHGEREPERSSLTFPVTPR